MKQGPEERTLKSWERLKDSLYIGEGSGDAGWPLLTQLWQTESAPVAVPVPQFDLQQLAGKNIYLSAVKTFWL